MSYFAGIDLHKRYLTLCILDPEGNVAVQHRRLSTEGLFAVLVHGSGLVHPVAVALCNRRFQVRALGELPAALEDGRREGKAGGFPAQPAIGFVQQLEDFHGVLDLRHDPSPDLVFI